MTSEQQPDFPNQHVRDLAAADHLAQWYGARPVAVGAGSARVELSIAEHMTNGVGTCHGGVIFTLADIALSYASNSHGATAVAASADVQFVTPARVGDVLIANATERYRYGKGARTGLYDVSVTRVADGELIAIFTGRTVRLGS